MPDRRDREPFVELRGGLFGVGCSRDEKGMHAEFLFGGNY